MALTTVFPMTAFPAPAACNFTCSPWDEPTGDSEPCVPSAPTVAGTFPFPLINPGAELDMTGWTNNGLKSWLAELPAAPAGTQVFSGNIFSAGGTAHQDIALPTEMWDVENSYVEWSWLQGSYDTDRDGAAIHMAFLDSGGGEISKARTWLRTVIQPASYQGYDNQAWIPVGTRTVRVEIQSQRGSATNYGDDANGSVDEIVATAYYDSALTVASANLGLINGNGASGMTGWTVTDAGPVNTSYLGKTCFFGGNDEDYGEMYQDVSLVIGGLTPAVIDTGTAKFRFDFAATRYADQGDEVRPRFTFYDELDAVVLDEYQAWGHPDGWTYANEMLTIPATSRKVRIIVTFRRIGAGSNNNSYITDMVCTGYWTV